MDEIKKKHSKMKKIFFLIYPLQGENNKRKRVMLYVTAIFLVIALLLFLYWLLWLRFEESTDDAYVDGNMIQINPQTSGIVNAIYADNTDFVEVDQPLVELDTTDARIALEESFSQLALNVRNVVQMFETVEEMQAQVEQKTADFIRAAQDYSHRLNLVDEGGVSREDYEHSEAELLSTQAALNLAEHQLNAAIAQVENTTVFSHPLVEEGMDMVRRNWVVYNRCNIVAPASGLIAQRTVQLGEWVTPAVPLLAVVPIDQMWITANFKEVQLANLRIGQPVKVTVDMYGSSVVYHGKVVGLTPGTGSVFSILPPQNATGNWIKIVQRVPVRISLDPEELKKHPLVLGLSVEVQVDLHHKDGLVLPKAKPVMPIYKTDVYEKQEFGVEEVIDAIIRANVDAKMIEEDEIPLE